MADELLAELAQTTRQLALMPGEILFEAGDLGDTVYVVVEGAMQIYARAADGSQLVLAALRAGELVGEYYLLENVGTGQRSAAARASEPTLLLCLDGSDFLSVLDRTPALDLQLRERRVRRAVTKAQKPSEILKLLDSMDALDPQHADSFSADEIIFREGDAPEAAWLITAGEVRVYAESKPDTTLARLGPGQCFGERACLSAAPRSATVQALTRVSAVRISREHFVRLHEQSPQLREIVAGLDFVYQLPRRGLALQFFGNRGGEGTVERLYRLEDGRRYLSCWIPTQQAFRLEQLSEVADAIDLTPVARWTEEAVGLPTRQRAITCSSDGLVLALAAVGEWPEMPQIIEAIIDGVAFNTEALGVFVRTGNLGKTIPPDEPAMACFCVQLSTAKIRTLIAEGHDSLESLRQKTGCGSLCGGCEPQIQSLLGRAEWTPVRAESRNETSDIRTFILKPTCVAALKWQPGQHVVLSGRIGPHWVNRSYTITSPPVAGQPLEIAVKREPKGLLSRWLFQGDIAEKELRIAPPRGDSLWTPNGRPTVCFVAGIGVTPALAILRARRLQAKAASPGPLCIDYSGRTPETMAFLYELESSAEVDREITCNIRFTASGRRLDAAAVAETAAQMLDAEFYVCGPPVYTDQVVSALAAVGVPSTKIHEERFAHAGAPPPAVDPVAAGRPLGPDALQYLAQDRVLAAGQTLVPEEMIKRKRHPLDRWDELVARAETGEFPAGIDVFLSKYQGLFYVAPAQDAFMCRLRIPNGVLSSWQMRGIANAADSFGGGYVDVTTRANLQIREIPARHAIDILLGVRALGLTSLGAGGDNIRNITGSPTAGIDPQELIDTRPLCLAMHHYILNHREMYGLPRKFNISFDGGGRVVAMEDTNDIGFVATRVISGSGLVPGVYFRLQLGGISGHRDLAFESGALLEPGECVSVAGAILRVFIQHGDRTNRRRARLKYVLEQMGREAFLSAVEAEWGAPLRRSAGVTMVPRLLADKHGHVGIHPQSQAGRHYLGVVLPVGRITTHQLRGLTDLAERFGSGTVRLTVWQNLLLPDVADANLAACIACIRALGLDIAASTARRGLVACTGNTGCKFAAANTKAHALQLADYLDTRLALSGPINIHLTGCRNSCAQHYVGDIGLLATKVETSGASVEGYHVYIGGGVAANGEQAIACEYATNVVFEDVPEFLERLLAQWLARRHAPEETFSEFVHRHDIADLRAMGVP